MPAAAASAKRAPLLTAEKFHETVKSRRVEQNGQKFRRADCVVDNVGGHERKQQPCRDRNMPIFRDRLRQQENERRRERAAQNVETGDENIPIAENGNGQPLKQRKIQICREQRVVIKVPFRVAVRHSPGTPKIAERRDVLAEKIDRQKPHDGGDCKNTETQQHGHKARVELFRLQPSDKKQHRRDESDKEQKAERTDELVADRKEMPRSHQHGSAERQHNKQRIEKMHQKIRDPFGGRSTSAHLRLPHCFPSQRAV